MSGHPVRVRLYAWFDNLTGDYKTRDEVAAFIKAEKADPEKAAELACFSDALMFQALMQAVAAHRNAERFAARAAAANQTTRDRMSAAIANVEAGVPHGLFDDRYKIDEAGTQRLAADMTGPDHAFVAARYSDQSKRNGLFAAFHRTVSRKIGDQRTSAVYSLAQYEALYQRLVADRLARRPDAA